MDALAFLAKTIGITGRVGAAFALGALLMALLRGMNVEPLASIDKSTYGAIVAAGIIGACTVVVDFIIAFWGFVKEVILNIGIPFLTGKVEKRRNRKTALKNLQTLRPVFAESLGYLKARDLKRFSAPAPERNVVLRDMVRSSLIEIDDPNYERLGEAYYCVPNYVWDRIEHPEPVCLPEHRSESPPWLFPHKNRNSR